MSNDFWANPLVSLAMLAIGFWVWWWLDRHARARNARIQQMHNRMQDAQSRSASMQKPMHNADARSAYAQSASAYARGDAQMQPASVQTIKLSTISDADNVLVAGPKGAGKTTVLRTLLHRRMQRADEIAMALDPHASPGKWPCTVIGGGLDWPAIDAAMQHMELEMRSRFQDLNAGVRKEGAFQRRNYVGDEFLSIAQELDGKNGRANAGKLLISRLVQGRKVGEAILVAAQNDTVEALGIQGNADLKGCFDYIIFLGSLVSTRGKYHGCPAEVIAAATKEARVGVVWHPERNNWYVLDYDLEPIREGQLVSAVSPVPPVPVRPESAEIGGTMPLSYQYGRTGTGGTAHQEAINTGTDYVEPISSRYELVRLLVSQKMSGNKVFDLIGGTRSEVLEMVRRAKDEVSTLAVDAA